MKIIIRILLLVVILFSIKMTQAQDVNHAKYSIVRHSSSYDANQCGHLVVDGSQDTYWESLWDRKNPNKLQWIEIDLGAEKAINDVYIHWGSNFSNEYKIFGKGNDNTWFEISSELNGKGGLDKISANGLEARYVKIEAQKMVNPFRGCIINEVEIVGEGESKFMPSTTQELSSKARTLNGTNWRVQNASFIKADPATIASAKYVDTEWIPAIVPGTILNSYYQFGAVPDPLFGDDIHQISDEFFSGNDFWYRNTLDFNADLEGNRLFLNFSGINWKSKIYFNGVLLGQIDGGFQRGEFEITDLVQYNKENTLAVLVIHNDNWVSGEFKVIQKELGDRTTNGDMLGLDGPTSLASAGWNWLPIIPGRNNGIWNNVHLEVRKEVSIKDTWVTTSLNLPDTNVAELNIQTTLFNQSSEKQKGDLIIDFGYGELRLPVTLAANEAKEISIDQSDFSELTINAPKLWWPNGYGDPVMHDLKLSFVSGSNISDVEQTTFGIRQLDYEVENGVLFVYCNGVRLSLKGGNWGLPEALMRVDSAGYDLRLKLHQEANFNMIRNWIGMINHEEFYNSCDRYGMLIFDDFWLANPKNGPDPRDSTLFMNNVEDKIKWVRKHPSVAFYCGRNEGLPPIGLDLAMEAKVKELDGSRHYVPHSAAGTVGGFGPYDVRKVEYYFKKRGNTLHSEQGIIAIPEPESMRRMMSEEDLWPISDTWAKHNYQAGRSEKYTRTINERFGKPNSMEEYSSKAQLWNYESGKAMFECLQSNQGSGMLLWMSQSAWPSLICQLYDHYFEYTASYFGVKKGSSPIHVFWDKHKNEIRAANNTNDKLEAVMIKTVKYNRKGEELWSGSNQVTIEPTSAIKVHDLLDPYGKEVQFLILEMFQGDQLLASNFYWLENRAGNCLDLNDLAIAEVKIETKSKLKDGVYYVDIKLKNTSAEWALLNKIKLKDAENGESILPVFFDDDYVSIMPGETRSILMRVDEINLMGKQPQIHLEGWNTKHKTTEFPFSN